MQLAAALNFPRTGEIHSALNKTPRAITFEAVLHSPAPQQRLLCFVTAELGVVIRELWKPGVRAD